jgi:hypothetical protein
MNLAIGVSAMRGADTALMQQAGIGWVRQDFDFPFTDRLGGALTEKYVQAREEAREWNAKGFQVMGVTPLIGIGGYKPDSAGQLRFVWNDWLPDWMGAPGSAELNRRYRSLCEFLADDLRGVVQMWQIVNEMDITMFAGPLNPRQSCELILEAAHGLKTGDPALAVGTNTAGSDRAYYLYGRLFADPDAPLDYCGVDAYYGSWAEGSPERWGDRITELNALTGVKVMVNEWGFASRGDVVTEEERRRVRAGASYCQFRKWPHAWGAGHTPESQADYVRVGFDQFVAHRESLMGAFFYRWEDQEACWQCGSPECPLETAWGLVDVGNRPKPSYHAFRDGVARLLRSS